MINQAENKNQPFSRLYLDKPALVQSETKAFTEADFNSILETFEHLYGFSPLFLVTLIQSVIDLRSKGVYKPGGSIEMNLLLLASPKLLRKERALVNHPQGVRKLEQALSNGELVVNRWSYARTLFHEVLHSVFQKGTTDLLISAANLDLKTFTKAYEKSHVELLFIIWNVLKNRDDDKLIEEKIDLQEFKNRKKKYGEEYAVLVLYRGYLCSLEELIIRCIDKVIADHFKIKLKVDQNDYLAFKEHESVFGPHPVMIPLYTNRVNYFTIPEKIIIELRNKYDKWNHFDSSNDTLHFTKEVIDEYFPFASFQNCAHDSDLPAEILEAVDRFNGCMGQFSKECVGQLSSEIYDFLLPYCKNSNTDLDVSN